jgi:hypothetical protein
MKSCREEKADLASTASEEEQRFVQKTFLETNPQGRYIFIFFCMPELASSWSPAIMDPSIGCIAIFYQFVLCLFANKSPSGKWASLLAQQHDFIKLFKNVSDII